MIYVTHRLDEVITISDRILVMRDGYPVAQGETQHYDVKALVKAIVGEETRENKENHCHTIHQKYCN